MLGETAKQHLQLNLRPSWLARGHLGPEWVGGHQRQAGRAVLTLHCCTLSVYPCSPFPLWPQCPHLQIVQRPPPLSAVLQCLGP